METLKNILAAKKMVYLAAGGNPVGREQRSGNQSHQLDSGAEKKRKDVNGLIRLQAVVEIVSNHTSDALELLAQQHSQMRAFVYQNRITLDYLLAEEGGVCVKFNESECCIEINDYGETIKGLAAEIKKEAQLAQTLPLDFAVHNIQPGDWVLVKEWKEAPLVAKWHGPFQVLLTTETAVKTAEHRWTHPVWVMVSEALEIWTSQLEEKDRKPRLTLRRSGLEQ
ncbi:hypothetical protein DUI87_01125 [Hirundo rustica rustica]|uniref:Murine leukemia virus integrase C-terminal domain-containing protein n=1 Tax=Hirundo rustica rustica TaxID=333673 RepID=A0A3M0L406_HIRRU|nr:hypothetical protein DUI87_01125 [Hirundo rustica rustica]